MPDLRKLAEACKADQWYTADDAELADVIYPEGLAFIAAANPRAVIGLLDERDAYHIFAVRVARMVVSPEADDLADKLTAEDLDTLGKVVRAEYENSHASGDRARFARCIEDLARALGLDVRRAPEWGEMVGRVRAVVRRAEVAAARWEWFRATSRVLVLYFHTPGGGQINVAVIEARDDGMWSVKANGQKRTAADDLPAALATIRAVLGADVPEIPTEDTK